MISQLLCFFIFLTTKQGFFAELQDREEEFGISDIQLGLATLEEVFLNIARKAELESAAVDGTMVTLDLTSGSSVEVNNLHLIHSYLYIETSYNS